MNRAFQAAWAVTVSCVVLLAAGGCAGGRAAAGRAAGGQVSGTPATGATTSPAGLLPQSTGPAAAEKADPSPNRGRLPLAGDIITIDPGHNGGNAAHPEIVNQLVDAITEKKPCDTTGTETDAGYAEHAFSFDVAIRLAAILRKKGAKVVLTRHSDGGVGPCITERAAIGNRAHANAAISIHADGGSPGGTGFEVIEPGLVPGYTNNIVVPSRRLGLDIRDAYRAITGEPYSNYLGRDGLDVRTDLGGLNLSKVPKVFIECANMRNSADAARLTSAAFRQRIAVALAAGLTAFLRGQ